MEKIEQHAVIKHCTWRHHSCRHAEFMNVENHVNGILYIQVACSLFDWTRKHCRRWPRRTTKNYRKGKVRDGKEGLNEDRKKTIDELADHFDVSCGTVYYIINNELKMTNVSARWVPDFWVNKTSEYAFKRQNIFLNATHRKRAFLAEHHYAWWITSPKKAKVIKCAQKVVSLQSILPYFQSLRAIFAGDGLKGWRTLNVPSRKLLELFQRTGFPRCTLNGLGDMENASRREMNTSRKTKKMSASWRCFDQSAAHVQWCMICMYFLNIFCVCQLCCFFLWITANLLVVMITKNTQVSMILFLFF